MLTPSSHVTDRFKLDWNKHDPLFSLHTQLQTTVSLTQSQICTQHTLYVLCVSKRPDWYVIFKAIVETNLSGHSLEIIFYSISTSW